MRHFKEMKVIYTQTRQKYLFVGIVSYRLQWIYGLMHMAFSFVKGIHDGYCFFHFMYYCKRTGGQGSGVKETDD